MEPVYLDHAAHGPMRSSVADAYVDAAQRWGVNANNRSHAHGRAAAAALAEARARVGSLIGAEPGEITFTSGATESNNLAILGVGLRTNRRRMVTVATEHASVHGPIDALEQFHDFDVTYLEVDRWGRLDLERVLEAIDDRVALVSIMLANNEIGTLHDLTPIGARCRELGVPLHSDLTQAVGRIPVDVRAMNLDLATFSSHKLHGPLGIGTLWVDSGVLLEPVLFGGNPDHGFRPGTPQLPAAMAFAQACDEAADRLRNQPDTLSKLTQRLVAGLERVPGIVRVSPCQGAVPGIVNVAVPGLDAQELLDACPEVIAATGSACANHVLRTSRVIEAIDLPRNLRLSCLRLSPGWFTLEEDIDRAVASLTNTIHLVRERSGVEVRERESQS